MSTNYVQSMLFGLVCSDFVFEGISKSEDEIGFLHLSYPMVDLLARIQAKAIDLAEDRSSYFKNADSLLDFVILAYLYQYDINSLKNLIVASSEHADLIASQLGIVALTHAILEKHPHEEYFSGIWDFSSGISDDYDMTIRKIGHVLGWGSESHARWHIGTGKSPQALVTHILYTILKHPNDYELALSYTSYIPKTGDIPANIFAMLMGIKLGLDALPTVWVEHCENRKYILKLAENLDTHRIK